MTRNVTFAEIDAQCDNRPAGYREELMAARSGDWEGGIVLDSEGEAYRSLVKKYAAKPRARGLGDTVARLTSAVGIKPCPKCKERQATLNRIMPYRAPEASPRA